MSSASSAFSGGELVVIANRLIHRGWRYCLKLSYIKTPDETLYIRYDHEAKQWNLYEDENGEQITMRNVHIESWVADPGAKLYPNSKAERDEMCNSLRRGIQSWEQLLVVDPSNKRPKSLDAQTIAALDAEKKERFKLLKQGVKRMRAELERLRRLKRF